MCRQNQLSQTIRPRTSRRGRRPSSAPRLGHGGDQYGLDPSLSCRPRRPCGTGRTAPRTELLRAPHPKGWRVTVHRPGGRYYRGRLPGRWARVVALLRSSLPNAMHRLLQAPPERRQPSPQGDCLGGRGGHGTGSVDTWVGCLRTTITRLRKGDTSGTIFPLVLTKPCGPCS